MLEGEHLMTDMWAEWQQLCERESTRAVYDDSSEDLRRTYILERADAIQAAARKLAGVACEKCYGEGRRLYNSTATWHGGAGGSTMTDGVCDRCWGTGRNDETGPDLRRIEHTARVAGKVAASRVAASMWLAMMIGAKRADVLKHLPIIAAKLERARWGDDFGLHRTADRLADALREMAKEPDDE